MTSVRRKVLITFPHDRIGEPILYTLYRDFEVVPNIRGASVTDEMAIMALEMDGVGEEIDRAVAWLKEQGAKVEEMESGNGPDSAA